jgi:hypothetical protein
MRSWARSRVIREQGGGRHFVPLEMNRFYKDQLLKIEIEQSQFEEINAELFACGVNRATLFPDLDGLSDHLKHRYFKMT